MTVLLDVWTIPSARIPAALWRMARDPFALRNVPGLTFHKSLGTGAGKRFTATDADLRQWALLTVWAGDPAPLTSTANRWQRLATGHTRLELSTIATHGQWSGQEPFIADPGLRTWPGPVAAITRAKVKTRQWRAFQQAVPPVASILDDQPGLLFRIGIGEAPVGLQGTFSVWRDAAAIREFAYTGAEHRAVIDQTRATNWYAEELFARFAVVEVSGDSRW
jgi:hypothetical protein